MQSIDGRRKLDLCKILWIGFNPNRYDELCNIYRQHNLTVSDFKMNGRQQKFDVI